MAAPLATRNKHCAVVAIFGLLLCLTAIADAQLIKLPRLSGRLRFPFFRKPGKEQAGGQQNVETDLTNFLQNGAQPGSPTLHKLFLKQYNGPPLPNRPGFPQATHLYPTAIHPFGMPRAPNGVPYFPAAFPVPGGIAGHMPGRIPGLPPSLPAPGAFGYKPLGTAPTYMGVPAPRLPPPHFGGPPRPPPPPPPGPPKAGPHRGHKSPPIVFADKDLQGGNSYDDSEEVDDDVPIVIRGRKHPKRRRPIVIEDIDSEEDDARPILVRGRKPYRPHNHRRPFDEDEEEEDFYNNRGRPPITIVQELSEPRPYRVRPAFNGDFPGPMKQHSYGDDRFLSLPGPPMRSHFFQPDTTKFDHIMTSEQTNHERATPPPFFSGAPPVVIDDVNRIMASRHQYSLDGHGSSSPLFVNGPKLVLPPHFDSPPPVRDRYEHGEVYEQKGILTSGKDMSPLVLHLPERSSQALQDKYLHALIVPIQSSMDGSGEDTSSGDGPNRALYGNHMQVKVQESAGSKSYVIVPQGSGMSDEKGKDIRPSQDAMEQEGTSKQAPETAQTFPPATYVKPPAYMDGGRNSIQTSDPDQGYAQPTAIRIVVRNPVDGSSREVFSTSLSTGNYQAYYPEQSSQSSQQSSFIQPQSQEGSANRVVIVAIPSDEAQQTPSSRSSSAVNTYYQGTGSSDTLKTESGPPPRYDDTTSKLQYLVPKIPYTIPLPTTQSTSSPSNPSKGKYQYRTPVKTSITSSSTKSMYPFGVSIPAVRTSLGSTKQKTTDSLSTADSSFPMSSYFGTPQSSVFVPKQNVVPSPYEASQSVSPAYYGTQQSYGIQSQPVTSVTSTATRTQSYGSSPAVQQYTGQSAASVPQNMLPAASYGSSYTASGQGIKEYPSLSALPVTTFSCQDRAPGFYADVQHKCQVYHQCEAGGSIKSFLCPNGTIFNQQSLVCEWWYNVDCPNSYYNSKRFTSPSSSPRWSQNPSPQSPSSLPGTSSTNRQQQSYSASVSYSVGGTQGSSSYNISPKRSKSTGPTSTYGGIAKQTTDYSVRSPSHTVTTTVVSKRQVNATLPAGTERSRTRKTTTKTRLQGGALRTGQRRVRRPTTTTTTTEVPVQTST